MVIQGQGLGHVGVLSPSPCMLVTKFLGMAFALGVFTQQERELQMLWVQYSTPTWWSQNYVEVDDWMGQEKKKERKTTRKLKNWLGSQE